MKRRSRYPIIGIFVIAGYTTLWPICAKAVDIFPENQENVMRGVLFKRLKDNKILYQLNADEPLSPASTTKILTSAASLQIFSPSYQFKTEFLYTGTRRGGKIDGSLVVKGSGDPYLTSEKLWQLAADLRHLGLQTISGDIVIDNALFTDETHDKSRQGGINASTHAYDAPISAFGINFNTFALAIAPATKIGAKALVGLDPYDIQGLEIVDNLTTVHEKNGTKPAVSRLSPANEHTRIVLNGSIPTDEDIVKVYRSTTDPVWTSGKLLQAFLAHEGITVKGKIREATPSDLKNGEHLYTLEGYEMAYIVKGLNRFSNNFIADMLVKNLGAYAGKEGTMAAGIDVITKFLADDVGMKPLPILKNGSGLDERNRISATQLVNLLSYMYKRIDIFPEFAASLPVASRDGTMEKRMSIKGLDDIAANVRAKTGTLTEPITVASLAGYLYHPDHGLIAFAIIDNGINRKPQPDVASLKRQQDIAIGKLFHAL